MTKLAEVILQAQVISNTSNALKEKYRVAWKHMTALPDLN